jgi:hypothetical protein
MRRAEAVTTLVFHCEGIPPQSFCSGHKLVLHTPAEGPKSMIEAITTALREVHKVDQLRDMGVEVVQ